MGGEIVKCDQHCKIPTCTYMYMYIVCDELLIALSGTLFSVVFTFPSSYMSQWQWRVIHPCQAAQEQVMTFVLNYRLREGEFECNCFKGVSMKRRGRRTHTMLNLALNLTDLFKMYVKFNAQVTYCRLKLIQVWMHGRITTVEY